MREMKDERLCTGMGTQTRFGQNKSTINIFMLFAII